MPFRYLIVVLIAAGCSSGSGNNHPDAGDASPVDAADGDGFTSADDGDPVTDDGFAGDEGDPGGDEPWPWCPSASAYHGDLWDWRIRAVETAVYCVFCAPSADSSTLPFELQRKAEMLIVPGEYPLPSSPGEYEFRLPICLNFREPDSQPLLDDPGTLMVSQMTHNGTPYLYFDLEQPLRTATGAEWLLRMRISKPAGDGEDTILLDGTFLDPAETLSVAFSVCESPCDNWMDIRDFASCHFEGVPAERHRLVFAGGQVELYLRISPGYSLAGHLPALFEHAEGVLDGQAFRQEDYWSLAFTGGIQHYLNRHFAFLFDTPIGMACGLMAENLDIWISDPPVRLTTIQCDLTEIEERAVSLEEWEELRYNSQTGRITN